jgi:hypothetical protein
MSELDGARAAFLAKLNQSIRWHGWKRTFDAWLYQFLVIGAAVAGFLALAFGLLAEGDPKYSFWAGAVELSRALLRFCHSNCIACAR